MPEWVYYFWMIPIELLLIVWAAFIVIGVKGLLFHRQPRHTPQAPPDIIDPDTGEVIRPQGLGLGCSMCLLFFCWPLFVATKIDEWLPPPQSN